MKIQSFLPLHLAVVTGIVDPVLGGLEHDESHPKYHEKEQPRHGRAHRHILIGEKGLVKIEVVEHGRAAGRPGSLTKHERNRKILEETDYGQCQVKK